METIIAFGWGAVTMFYVGMIVVVFQLRKSVKQLESDVMDTDGTLAEIFKTVIQKEKETMNYVDTLHNTSENHVNEIYRYIDSRFDKFENKITNKQEILKG
jgi:hypothetical protein